MLDMEGIRRWFLDSPIYDKNEGAYRAYYTKDGVGPIYPEITAYALSLSCILYKQTHKQIFLSRAEECAKYLMRTSDNGGVASYVDGSTYAFDTGIFISALFDLFEVSRKPIYLAEAQKSMSCLLLYWNGEELSATNASPANEKWYNRPSAHLAKMAIPLMKGSYYLKDISYEKIASAMLDKYRRFQSQEGRFRIEECSEKTMTHPHCYATEGFLYAYWYSGKQEYLEIVKKSIDWLSKIQNTDGSFYEWYPVSEKASKLRLLTRKSVGLQGSEITDATAQATRLWKLLGENKDGIDRAYRFLNGKLRGNGLVLHDRKSLLGNPFTQPKVYSWPTFFYLHSLGLPFGETEYINELF